MWCVAQVTCLVYNYLEKKDAEEIQLMNAFSSNNSVIVLPFCWKKQPR